MNERYERISADDYLHAWEDEDEEEE
jgi:hypothetical protein